MGGVAKGYRTILTMPETMSVERRNLLKAYGAELVLTPGAEGMKGAIRKAKELRDAPGASFWAIRQSANPAVHERTTGEEIMEGHRREVSIFVAGVGTGGTVSGTGRTLKRHNPSVKVYAVEPATSPVLSGGAPGKHGIQGIGSGFVPQTYDAGTVDKVLTVSTEEAFESARFLSRKKGILVGISSGAAFHAAAELSRLPENEGKLIVAVLPDTGERYLSTALFDTAE